MTNPKTLSNARRIARWMILHKVLKPCSLCHGHGHKVYDPEIPCPICKGCGAEMRPKNMLAENSVKGEG